MKVKEIYKKHDKRTINYMEFVVEQIQKDYMIVPSSWRLSLDLIADSLDIYFSAMDDIKTNGIFKHDEKDRISKNGAVAIQNVCLQNVVKLLNNFGLTPLSKVKLKQFDAENEEDDAFNKITNC